MDEPLRWRATLVSGSGTPAAQRIHSENYRRRLPESRLQHRPPALLEEISFRSLHIYTSTITGINEVSLPCVNGLTPGPSVAPAAKLYPMAGRQVVILSKKTCERQEQLLNSYCHCCYRSIFVLANDDVRHVYPRVPEVN